MTNYCNRKAIYHYKNCKMGKVPPKGKTSVEEQSGQRNVTKAASQRYLRDLYFFKILLMILKMIFIDNKIERHYKQSFLELESLNYEVTIF